MTIPSIESLPFGALLKAFRTRRRLTQQQLASAMGRHRHAIVRWEQGDVLPATRGIVLELARHLRLDDQETRHLLEASLTAPAPHWGVSLPRNPFFTGREDLLEALHTRLSTDQGSSRTPVYALQGLGGIGKTQIALEYAYRHALEYNAVFWIEAETGETALSSLVRIAELLQVRERQETNQQPLVAAVQRWLSSHSGWLLIWDNLDDLDLLPRLLPAVRPGAILLTTRCQALGTLARGLEVAPLEPEDGMRFLLRRAKALEPEATGEQVQQLAARQPGEYAAARDLVMTLGGLPLALDQAGAYLEETGCDLVGYLLRYQQQRHSLLDRRGEAGTDHPHSVAVTLGLACQKVAQQHPAALELLRFCACLSPEAIPEELLLAGAPTGGPALEPVVADLSHVDAALLTLRRFSLVQRQPDTHMLSLHRLVQVILQDGMSAQEHAALQQRAVQALHAVFPASAAHASAETWQTCERLIPHVLACLATIPEPLQDQDLAAVLLRAADYLCRRVRRLESEALYQRALQIFGQQLGADHPLVGSALHKLAVLYQALGRYEEAQPLFQRALCLLEHALGPEHPEVAFPLLGLAMVFRQQGHYADATPFGLRALRIREQALGPEHPLVAETLDGLGLLYQEQGHYEQAEALHQRALRLFEQALGSEHPNITSPLNNLGNLYREQGKYEQAESFCLRAVGLFEQALGPEHPGLAYPLDTLATLYGEMGHYEQAEPVHQRTLRLFEQALGPEHPLVAFPLQGLALLCRERGEDEAAEALYHRALQIREQRRGPRHPETAQTLHDLARLRHKQGQRGEALALAERALQIREQALGDAHPHTVASRMLFAQLWEASGDMLDGAPSIHCGEELPDRIRTGRQPEEACLTAHEAIDGAQSEQNPLQAFQAFLDTCCELDPLAWCRIRDLWGAYAHWTASCQGRIPLSRRTFAAQVKARGCRVDRTSTARIWRGIRLVKTSP